MDGILQYQQLKEKIRSYYPAFDEQKLDDAFALANTAHQNQKRLDGDPYITHPISVSIILADMELDLESIIAAILHDVVEDSNITNQDIKERFGATVADLVDGVTKLGRIPYSSKEEQQVENLRKMFLAMAKDVRVILIKLADRLHNMRTICSMPGYKQRQKALETMEVYSPLAHRLGMSQIKTELEDISIRCLDPAACEEIDRVLEERNRDHFLTVVQKEIGDRLNSYGVHYTIEGRQKSLYSIYRKVYAQNRGFEELYDLYAVRVIVDTVIDCYNVLGIIHDLYHPIPGRFKDYISTPKPNMYQSLHTTLIGRDGMPFEAQIRTWEMHQTAEFGIAAHWKYKAGVTGAEQEDRKLMWIRQLLETQREATDPEDFIRALKIDLFADEVFVFTPKGDVINLPLGSTIIDFAYNIHSAIGDRMIGAKVNGKMLHLDYVLKNGDVVQIITSGASTGPSLDWMKIAKTSEARTKIRQWFKREKREENIERGRDSFEKELKRSNLTVERLEQMRMMPSLLRKYHVNSKEELFAALGYGGIALSNVMLRVNHEVSRRTQDLKAKTSEEIQEQIAQAAPPRKSTNGIVIEGVDNVLVKFARCCNPLPGDDVIGYITKGFGISVHKCDCPNVKHGTANPEESHRWIPVRWDTSVQSSFTSLLQVTARERMGLLADVVTALSNMRVPVLSLNARGTKDGFSAITIKVQITNLEQLGSILQKLNKVPDVIDVSRANQ